MRGCPHACPGYTPAPEWQRPEQEVAVLGAEWHRGRTCPGVVLDDPLVIDVLEDFQALKNWCQGNSLQWWNDQPAWWTDAIRTVQVMRDTIEQEQLKRDAPE